jgi:hypothetical protein
MPKDILPLLSKDEEKQKAISAQAATNLQAAKSKPPPTSSPVPPQTPSTPAASKKIPMKISEIPPFSAAKRKPQPVPVPEGAKKDIDLGVPSITSPSPSNGSLSADKEKEKEKADAEKAKLNPNASTFVFKPNPGAAAFKPVRITLLSVTPADVIVGTVVYQYSSDAACSSPSKCGRSVQGLADVVSACCWSFGSQEPFLPGAARNHAERLQP